jgi:hypothetical protein
LSPCTAFRKRRCFPSASSCNILCTHFKLFDQAGVSSLRWMRSVISGSFWSNLKFQRLLLVSGCQHTHTGWSYHGDVLPSWPRLFAVNRADCCFRRPASDERWARCSEGLHWQRTSCWWILEDACTLIS